MQTRSRFRRDALREYAAASLWVEPAMAALAALVAGSVLSQVQVDPHSPLAPLAFQGTADDARALLTTIASTVVTIIALVLGLTVVALQLSSTQFSPRLLRNFLRDRATQGVLSVYIATFVYSAAGLYTVGVVSGNRTQDFPRLAVTGAIVLLFATLGMVVYFADHLAHSLQIDAITGLVQTSTLAVVRQKPGTVEDPTPVPPSWAVLVPATDSGYVETAHPERLLPLAVRHRVSVLVRPRVGEHVVAGTTLAWVWATSPDAAAPDPAAFTHAARQAVRIGFERTLEQDAAFGVRQLVDIACKALSPAINDPYTAVQAIDHLAVLFGALAARPVGDHVARDADGTVRLIVPGRRFAEILGITLGLLRRYGAAEPNVVQALLRLLATCAALAIDDPRRWAAIEREAQLLVADAERSVAQPEDLATVHLQALNVARVLSERRAGGRSPEHASSPAP
jgi:uncharacterized membrane protein